MPGPNPTSMRKTLIILIVLFLGLIMGRRFPSLYGTIQNLVGILVSAVSSPPLLFAVRGFGALAALYFGLGASLILVRALRSTDTPLVLRALAQLLLCLGLFTGVLTNQSSLSLISAAIMGIGLAGLLIIGQGKTIVLFTPRKPRSDKAKEQ